MKVLQLKVCLKTEHIMCEKTIIIIIIIIKNLITQTLCQEYTDYLFPINTTLIRVNMEQ